MQNISSNPSPSQAKRTAFAGNQNSLKKSQLMACKPDQVKFGHKKPHELDRELDTEDEDDSDKPFQLKTVGNFKALWRGAMREIKRPRGYLEDCGWGLGFTLFTAIIPPHVHGFLVLPFSIMASTALRVILGATEGFRKNNLLKEENAEMLKAKRQRSVEDLDTEAV